MIGKLEEVVLLATIKARANALPSAIYEEIEVTVPPGGKVPAFGAVYTTITRMAHKGMLSEGSTVDGRGRSRKTFTVTAAGHRALQMGLQQTGALGGFKLAGALA